MLHVLVRNMFDWYQAPDAIGWMVTAGAVGVSTFFCLSGFILAYCYGDHRFQTWRCYFAFIGRRYARLLPVYWLSQLMCIGQQVNSVKAYGWDVWSVLHWLALATGTHTWWPWPEYDRAGPASAQYRGLSMLNPTLWALSVILFFYVSMPLLVRPMRWFVGVERLSELPRGSSTARLLLLWLLCVALVWMPNIASASWFVMHMPYPRIGEFCFGLVTAALYLSIRQRQQHMQAQQDGHVEGAVHAKNSALIDRLASSSLLHSPLTLDLLVTATILLYLAMGLPAVRRPSWMDAGSWLSPAISCIVLLLALTHSAGEGTRVGGFVNWLLTRPVALELGAMSFCFYAFHYVPLTYAESIGVEANRSIAVEFCAAIGLAWLGYKYVETPVYAALSARLPVCRCHKQ